LHNRQLLANVQYTLCQLTVWLQLSIIMWCLTRVCHSYSSQSQWVLNGLWRWNCTENLNPITSNLWHEEGHIRQCDCHVMFQKESHPTH